MSVLTLEDVTYKYEGSSKNVIKGINANFEAGKIYTIMGRSGSGKSTLLSLIAGLDVCESGSIRNHGIDIKKMDRDEYRSKQIGVIFQSYNLITNASALENIVLSMNISESKIENKEAHALDLLQSVGIDEDTANRSILKLSGGEQQRVGIARALSSNPDIIIADEPTGNLDRETEEEILEIFARLSHEFNKCVIIVTHSKEVTRIADEIYLMQAGLMKEVRQKTE